MGIAIFQDIIDAAKKHGIETEAAFEIIKEILGDDWQVSPVKTFGERVRAAGYSMDYELPCYDALDSLFAQYKARQYA